MRSTNKSLVKIKNRDLIDIQIENLSSVYPNADIIYLIGYEADSIYKLYQGRARFIFNPFYEIDSVVKSIRLGLMASLRDSLLLVCGDTFFDKSSIQNIANYHCSLTLSKNEIVSHDNKLKVGINSLDGVAEHFDYGIGPKWANILFLKGNEFKLFKKIIFNKESDEFVLCDIFNKIIEKGGKIEKIEATGEIFEIDSYKDIEVVNGKI